MAAARVLGRLRALQPVVQAPPLFLRASQGAARSGVCLGPRAAHTNTGDKDVGSLTRYDESSVTTDWQKKLTPEQFYATREKGTELPFSGIHLTNTEPGMYHCLCCNAALFRTVLILPGFYTFIQEFASVAGLGVSDIFTKFLLNQGTPKMYLSD